MKKNSAHISLAVRGGVRSCSKAWPRALVLFFISAAMGIGYLFEGNFRVGSAPLRQTTGAKSPASVSRPRSTSFVDAVARVGHTKAHLWRENERVSNGKSVAGIGSRPKSYRTLSLNEVAQRAELRDAPMEFTKAARLSQVVITLPMPDGTFARFRVEESPVMAPQLAALYPETKTYRGRGLDDPTATTRFDVTRAGFHAIVLSSQGTVIIEPDAGGRANNYISYDQGDAPKDQGSFSCVVYGAEQSLASESKKLARHSNANLTMPIGATLLTYRLALAATAEFTQVYGGGTVAGALSAIVTMTNAVNAIYERDLAIRLMLVANETSIIFTNAATDGYTSDNVPSLLTQNQAVLDQRIGPANYDVGMVLDGHVFAYLPGKFIFQGAAQYQSTCRSGQKGKAATILRSTDPSTISAIYVVAHELAHLFGALHTFNGTLDDCGPSRFAQVAYEPGSGSTIMGYRGGFLPDGTYYPLCSVEELHSTDTYFHTASIEQISEYTTVGSGAFCPSATDTGNNPPNVDAGANYTIPANTPFTLTATGSDSDADALTYCWEEYDLGAPGPPHTDNGNRPIFRSFAPVASPARTFPQLSDILSGTATFGESLPTTNRTMNFRVTVRDNRPGSGGVNAGSMSVNVVAGSGPFAVTQPTSATAWTAGSNQTVNWSVANTSGAPVSCANVRVLLSIDGGSSFPFILASSVPNSGAATVSIPNFPTSTARIKVEAIGNIFFSVSIPNFTITPDSTLAPTLLTEANTNQAVALDSVMFMRDPFPFTTAVNFSPDQRTRIALFAVGLGLMPGEDNSVVTAEAEDAAHNIFPLTIEYVGRVPNFDWLTQVNVRLPDGLISTGDILVSVKLRGGPSNKVVVGIR